MTVLRENLTLDLHYASETTAGEKLAKLTVVIRDNTTGSEVHTSTLQRKGAVKGSFIYKTGYQNIQDASDPLLLKLETFFRTAGKDLFEELMAQVTEMFMFGLNANSTWMGTYGLRITSGAQLDTVVPDSVFA